MHADLNVDEGWSDAVAGCRYVQHVASPFPLAEPKHEDDLIIPAREGALRVVRASRDAGVERIVLTSSFAAIGYGPKRLPGPYTEEDWTEPTTPRLPAYVKSKAIAERAAWDFIAKEGSSLQLAVVNPVGIFGPALGPKLSGSLQIVQNLLSGKMPALPRITFGFVDVRDVADIHERAMTDPGANGQRFLAIAGQPISMPHIAEVLREALGDKASKVTKFVMPDWLVRTIAPFTPDLSQVVPFLGEPKKISNEKARTVLHWSPRSADEAVIATGKSLVRLGLV